MFVPLKLSWETLNLFWGWKFIYFFSKVAWQVLELNMRSCIGRPSILNWHFDEFTILLFRYSVGGNSRRERFWEPILNKLRGRLAKWKHKSLSLGGRITLINSVLSSLPLFFLSFLKISSCVEKKLLVSKGISWEVGVEAGRKIARVKWNKVYLPKPQGGLGIKIVRLFGMALLGKKYS